MKKVLFISSAGGHLNELMQLEPMFKDYDYYLVTEKVASNVSLKKKFEDKIDFLVFGGKEHMISYPFKFLYNIFKSIYLYAKIRPAAIVTTGTHTAVPMCYIGKLCRSKVIYVETIANITTKTMAGKIIYPVADLFLVQWESMLELYPKAKYCGWIY